MLDLRKEFRKIMDDFGSKYIHVSSLDKQKCDCFNEMYKTGNDKCPACLGSGFISKISVIRGRTNKAAMPVSLPRIGQSAPFGQAIVPTRVFYLEHQVPLRTNDYLIICEWKDGKPDFSNDSLSFIYKIGMLDPQFGQNGRIEYYCAYSEANPVNAYVKFDHIKTRQKELSLYIAERD